MELIEVKNADQIIGIILKNDFSAEGIQFFTPNHFSQQLAYMHHQKGHVIFPHVHNLIVREVHFTQEVLIIKKGKLRVDFYDDDRHFLESHFLNEGDVILLCGGGHGFEVIEEVEMIEIKQGPYAGENDKTRFSPAE